MPEACGGVERKKLGKSWDYFDMSWTAAYGSLNERRLDFFPEELFFSHCEMIQGV